MKQYLAAFVMVVCVIAMAMSPRDQERMNVAGTPMAKPIPAPAAIVIDTNVPDLTFTWPDSADPNVTAYVLYYGHHYPVATSRTVWLTTTAYVTNAPAYHTEYWVTFMAGTNESVPSLFIPQDNGYDHISITVSCNGTGSVYQAVSPVGPWTLIKTAFHGTVGSWTNPVGNQFFKGPGMSDKTLVWNQ